MALLKDVQARYPNADVVVGRVICYHEMKHYDLGEYTGEGVVNLNQEGQKLMAPKKKEKKGEDKKFDPLEGFEG